MARLNWCVIAGMGLALALGMSTMGFSLEAPDLLIVTGIALLYGVTGWYHLRRKSNPDPKIVFTLTSIGQLILIVSFMGPLTYVGCAMNFPLQDQLFLTLDRALGIDP